VAIAGPFCRAAVGLLAVAMLPPVPVASSSRYETETVPDAGISQATTDPVP
jgi:hypothetical protein